MPENGIDPADYQALHRLVGLYSHVVDMGDWDALSAIFTEDATFDVTAAGLPRIEGLAELRRVFSTLQHPLAHHTTNLVIDDGEPDTAVLRSKALVVFDGGRVGSAEYHDVAVRTPRGWRLKARTVVRIRPPLSESSG